jgi:hypothetical protein
MSQCQYFQVSHNVGTNVPDTPSVYVLSRTGTHGGSVRLQEGVLL